MEPHKPLGTSIEAFRPPLDDPRAYFQKALAFARTFYADEIERAASVKFELVDPTHFFREYIWVVHATGFSAKAVGKFTSRLIEAYGPFGELAERSVQDAVERVSSVCNNPQKIKAVHATSRLIRDGISAFGWDEYKKRNLCSPDLLKKLPYVGPVTCFHLARNIGLLGYVKPDLHLIRLAEHWNFRDCTQMCECMSEGAGLPLGIVDLVVWYAASTFGTLQVRKEGQR